MFRALGFAALLVPPAIVFIFVAIQFSTGKGLPVEALGLIYPLGTLTLVLYSLSFNPSPSSVHQFLEFSKGARLATYMAFLGSVVVAFFPIFWGEPLLGPGLVFASFGSIWFPSASAAGIYGHLLVTGEKQLSQGELMGTRHGGIAVLFLALFLRKVSFLKDRFSSTSLVAYLAIAYLLGWVEISQAGGFPYSILGAMMVLLVPTGSLSVFRKTLSIEDMSRLSGIIASQ